MTTYKQAIVLRDDLSMSEGKKIVQACHASVGAYRNTDSDTLDAWMSSGAKKVALKVDGKESLQQLLGDAQRQNIATYAVKDAGRTEVPTGTMTCIGIGPAAETAIEPITGNLSLV